jgi:Nucleoside 2-deoxyribosyltransferase
MKIFLAGIMQGSHFGTLVHDQQYRQSLRTILEAHWPQAEVYDPFAGHANSISYSRNRAREVFLEHVDMCRRADLVIAFIPEASLGTAIEIWEAWQHGRTVVTISPMVHNWVVLLASAKVYRDQEEFQAALHSGQIDSLVKKSKTAKPD